MEINKPKETERLNRSLLDYIQSFNLNQDELNEMTLEQFINHAYNKNVK